MPNPRAEDDDRGIEERHDDVISSIDDQEESGELDHDEAEKLRNDENDTYRNEQHNADVLTPDED